MDGETFSIPQSFEVETKFEIMNFDKLVTENFSEINPFTTFAWKKLNISLKNPGSNHLTGTRNDFLN